MCKKIITFGNIEIEKRKFYHRKNLILLEDLYNDNIQVSTVVSSGKKNINILLDIKMMIIMKLNHNAQCFQKRAL